MLSPPGPTWPEEALSWVVLRLPGPAQPEEILVEGWWGSCPGPAQLEGRGIGGGSGPGSTWSEKALVGGRSGLVPVWPEGAPGARG